MNLFERALMIPIRHYYARVVENPASRVWYHNLYQQLESGGEVPDLDSCRGKLMDDWLEPLFDKHQDDENRHAAMWLALLEARKEYNPASIPDWANTVGAFCHRGWLETVGKLARSQPIHQAELIPMFAGIHALEHLAIRRFRLMSDLHRRIDPEISNLLDTIIRDEKAHQAYTRAAVIRLGERHGCPEYAMECLRRGVRAYRNYALSLMPYYVELLGRKGKGARFSSWFLLFNLGLKAYRRLRPELACPPPMPPALQAKVAAVEKEFGVVKMPIPKRTRLRRVSERVP